MKIGIVIDKLYPGKIGGAEQYVRNIISVMEKEENIELVLFLNEEAIGTFEKDNLERFHCVCVPNQISKPDSFFEYYIAKYGLQVLFCLITKTRLVNYMEEKTLLTELPS